MERVFDEHGIEFRLQSCVDQSSQSTEILSNPPSIPATHFRSVKSAEFVDLAKNPDCSVEND